MTDWKYCGYAWEGGGSTVHNIDDDGDVEVDDGSNNCSVFVPASVLRALLAEHRPSGAWQRLGCSGVMVGRWNERTCDPGNEFLFDVPTCTADEVSP